MKPLFRRGLGALIIVSCAAVWLLTSAMSEQQRRQRTCQGKGSLDVVISDSLERQFVGKADVAQWLEKEYRAYAGLPLDSVNLAHIENLVQSHSVVRSCQAWLTDDGILHLELSQRQPVVRFDDGSNGYYADASGFVFPLQARGSADVPVVDGHLPLKVARGFKGFPEDPAQQAWLRQMLGMAKTLHGSVWEKNIARITVGKTGDLVLTPASGREQFIFGPPVRVAEKLELMKAYYESVVPSREDGGYRTVDLRYRGQLVCRK